MTTSAGLRDGARAHLRNAAQILTLAMEHAHHDTQGGPFVPLEDVAAARRRVELALDAVEDAVQLVAGSTAKASAAALARLL